MNSNELKLCSERGQAFSLNSSEVNQYSVCIKRFDWKSSEVKVCSKLKQRYF